MEVEICIFPGPPGGSKCPSDLQLIDWPTENLLFATQMLFYHENFKEELQQIAFNHSSDIDFKDLWFFTKNCTGKPYTFLVTDFKHALDNP